MGCHPFLAALLALGLPAAAAAAPEDESDVRITFQVDIKSALTAELGTTAKRLTPEAAEEVQRKILDETVQVLGERLSKMGFEGHEVETAPDGRVVVLVPGVEEPGRIRKLLQKVGALEVRLVRFPLNGEGAAREAVLQSYGGRIPPDLELLQGEMHDKRGVMIGRWWFAVERRRLLSGRDVAQAYTEKNSQGEPYVVFHLTEEATQGFAEATRTHVDIPLAIVLDGQVISAHPIGEAIYGSGDIAASSQREAEALAAVLSSGPLPARVTVVEEHVSPAAFRWPEWLPAVATFLGILAFLAAVGVLAGQRKGRR